MTYVVSDLNGHLDVFRDLLKKISFSEKAGCDVCAGDIVDYGPQPMELVQDRAPASTSTRLRATRCTLPPAC